MALLPYHNTSPESTALIANGPGFLSSLTLVNTASTTRYAWVYKGTSTSGQRIAVIPLAANGGNTRSFVDERNPMGVSTSSGIYVASSTTNATFTAAGGTDFWIDAEGRDA